MRKKLCSLTALLMAVIMLFSFSSCDLFTTEDDASSTFKPAEIPTPETIPVTETEIISFFNSVISYVQKTDNFTASDKPGINTSSSVSVDDIKFLKYDTATKTAKEDDSLIALNKSASSIKDRIISGLDLDTPVIVFGDMNTSASTVIYPYDSSDISLDVNDVKDASADVDGTNLNITLTLNDKSDSIAKLFEIKDKQTVLNSINKQSASYAKVTDYTIAYVDFDGVTDKDNPDNNQDPVHSKIELSCEVEKNSDGTYSCTGRITKFKYTIVSDVTASITCGGSFADYGDIQTTFRLTETREHDFDWYGSATWEPTTATQ